MYIVKCLKIILILAGGLALLFIGGLVFFYFSPIPTYEVPAISIEIKSTPDRIKEGKRIAMMTCIRCHYNEQTNSLAGAVIPNPKAVEDNFASNVTQHKETGIGLYTDGELVYMLKTGINRRGDFVYDMPKYPLLSDEDMASIVSFLKSEDPLVRPVFNKNAREPYNLLIRVLLHTVLKPEKYLQQTIEQPDTNNKLEFGRYLCTAKFSCFSCHSNDLVGNLHWSNPEQSNNYFHGGSVHTGAEHKDVYSLDLSQDTLNGIGKWTELQFKMAVKNGIKPDGTTVRDPMFPWYLLTDREVSAIFSYLKTIKPMEK